MALGVGVMLQMLTSRDPVDVSGLFGQPISAIDLDEKTLTIVAGTKKISLQDEGQSCCESRYMNTDDDLAYYIGATLTNIELADAPYEEDEYGSVHEVKFLRVITDRGVITVANHNEHNGYYGGFAIQASVTDA